MGKCKEKRKKKRHQSLRGNEHKANMGVVGRRAGYIVELLVVHTWSVVVGPIDSAAVEDIAVAVHMAVEWVADHTGLAAALGREIEDMVKTFDQVEVGPAYCIPAVPGDMEMMIRKHLSWSEVKATAVVLEIRDVKE
jgi:hypothetical protein